MQHFVMCDEVSRKKMLGPFGKCLLPTGKLPYVRSLCFSVGFTKTIQELRFASSLALIVWKNVAALISQAKCLHEFTTWRAKWMV